MTTSSQKDLVDNFVLVVMEYIHTMNSSEILKALDDNEIVLSGLKSIIHVFKITYKITGCINTTIASVKKAIYCYLEYVEQMQKTQFVLNANIADAIVFVYSKTINELHASTCIPSNFENIAETQSILNQLDVITTTILWAHNPDINNIQRLELAHQYLHKSILLCLQQDANNLKVIQLIQEHIWMDYSVYFELVAEYLSQCKKKKTIIKDNMRNKMLYFLAYMKDKTLDEIAAHEGFKSKYDIVKWFYV
jgi:hypothetical protein